MDKQIIALLKHSGRMRPEDIGMAMNLDRFDIGVTLLRLAEHGKIVRHENWLTGAHTFSV